MINFVFISLIIIVFIASLRNLALGVSLTIAVRLLVPPFVRVQIGPYDNSLNTTLIIVLLIFLLYDLFFKKNKIEKMIPVLKYTIIIYCLYLFCSIIFATSVSYQQQISGTIKFIMTELILGCIAWYAFKNIKDIKSFFIIFSFAIIIAGSYGIFTYIIKLNPYISFINLIYNVEMDATSFIEEQRGVIAGRIQGTQAHALIWGQLHVIILCFLFLFRKKLNNGIYLLLVIIVILNAFLSGSRAVIISMLASISFFILGSKIYLKRKYIIGFIIIAPIFLFVFFSNKQFQDFSDTIKSAVFFWEESKNTNVEIKGSSISMRTDQLNETFYQLNKENSTLFGLGEGWIQNYNAKYGSHPILHGFESIFFHITTQKGIIGLLAFFIFYLNLYKITWRKTKQIKDTCNLYLVNGYFVSFLLSIILTGIQSSIWLFFVLIVIYLKYTSKIRL